MTQTWPAIPGMLQQHDIGNFRMKAVLFDLDGTLLDSEPLYKDANVLFLGRHGISVPRERWHTFVGIGARAFIRIMQEEFGLAGEPEALMAEMDACFSECAARGIPVFSGSRDLAVLCRQAGIPVAIASGSTPGAIDRSLAHGGMEDLFPLRVSANQVPRGKPAPDVFLEAARQLGVEPHECLVLEDSRSGVRSGLAAGMVVLAFTDHLDSHIHSPSPDPDYSRAHFLVPGGPVRFEAEPFFRRILGPDKA